MELSNHHIPNLIGNLASKKETVIYLDSQLTNHRSSKRSLVAFGVQRSITAYGDNISIFDGDETQHINQNPWEALRDFRAKGEDWVFGYLGYDLKNFIEDLES